MFSFEKPTCENQPDVSEAQYFRLLTKHATFTQQNIEIIEQIAGKCGQFEYSSMLLKLI